MTALADGLYLLSCYLYVVLILISFESYYLQENITIKSASPLNLSKHSFLSSFVDGWIYIFEFVSVWLVYHGLHASLDSLFVSLWRTGLHRDLLRQQAWYSLSWIVVFSQVLCSAQVAPAEVSGHQESNQKRSDGGTGKRSIHESSQTQVRSCKLSSVFCVFFFQHRFREFVPLKSWVDLSHSFLSSFLCSFSSSFLSSCACLTVCLPLQRFYYCCPLKRVSLYLLLSACV